VILVSLLKLLSDRCFRQVKIMARDLSSLEKSKTIIANLTMVPKVGEIYRYSHLPLVFYLYCFSRSILLLISCSINFPTD
jgi:hypothetical protein